MAGELRKLTHNSPQVQQFKIVQTWAGNGQHPVRQAAQLQAMADDHTTKQLLSLYKGPITMPTGPCGEDSVSPPHHLADTLPSPSSGGPASAPLPVIQRSLYLDEEGRTVKKKPRDRQGPAHDPGLWSDDAIHRHFRDQQELSDYEAGRTEHIGPLHSEFLGAERVPWVRLENELLVLGEKHDEVNLIDIVKAVRTPRFMYEGIHRIPGNRNEAFPSLTKKMQLEEKNIPELQNWMSLLRNEQFDHHLEHFYPKITYGLVRIDKCIRKNQSSGEVAYNIEEIDAYSFGLGLRFAQDMNHLVQERHTQKSKALAKEWADHAPVWRAMIDHIDSFQDIEEVIDKSIKDNHITPDHVLDMIRKMVDYFRSDYLNTQHFSYYRHVNAVHKGMMSPAPDHNTMIEKANKWREQYMMKRINDAVRDKYLLVGMGEDHLRAISKKPHVTGVKYKFIDGLLLEFSNDQKNIEQKSVEEGDAEEGSSFDRLADDDLDALLELGKE